MRQTKFTAGKGTIRGRARSKVLSKVAGQEELGQPDAVRLGSHLSQDTLEGHAALLEGLKGPGRGGQRAQVAQSLQRLYGNRYVHGLIGYISRKRAGVIHAGPAVIQRDTISEEGYTASNGSSTFRSDHLADDEEYAIEATLGRANNGRGAENTVLLHTDEEIKKQNPRC
ncbi:MAG: hypothetical protein FJ316_01800 [SAR202 cluster bacterium]|nr:hypothetical protein [SAR202 cluster bacterium]